MCGYDVVFTLDDTSLNLAYNTKCGYLFGGLRCAYHNQFLFSMLTAAKAVRTRRRLAVKVDGPFMIDKVETANCCYERGAKIEFGTMDGVVSSLIPYLSLLLLVISH